MRLQKFVDDIGDRMTKAFKQNWPLFMSQWLGILFVIVFLSGQCAKVLGLYALTFPLLYMTTSIPLIRNLKKTGHQISLFGDSEEKDDNNNNWPDNVA